MAHGSRLMAHASRMAYGQLGPRAKFCIGHEHEPWGMSHEAWAMSHEPLAIAIALINYLSVPYFQKFRFLQNMERVSPQQIVFRFWYFQTNLISWIVFVLSWISLSNLVGPKSRIMGS